MDWASGEIVDVLNFLLPGFVCTSVVFNLISFPKPSEFERIIQALILTAFCHAIAVSIKSLSLIVGAQLLDLGPWTATHDLIVPIVVALVLGLLLAWAICTDRLHSMLRRFSFTRENSYPSEWYSAFARHAEHYVVLHLDGERRLYGWPTEWPSSPAQGHFAIDEAEWLLENQESVKLDPSATVVVPVSQVELVEFVPNQASPAGKASKGVLERGKGTESTAQGAARPLVRKGTKASRRSKGRGIA